MRMSKKCNKEKCNKEVQNKRISLCPFHYGEYLLNEKLEDRKIIKSYIPIDRSHKSLENKKFGKLIVEKYSHLKYISNKPRHYYSCICECGIKINALSTDLLSGHTTRCGTSCKIDFMNKLTEKFPNRNYTIKSDYAGVKTKILVENKYGECLVYPTILIKGVNFSINSAINKTEYWINQAQEIHGDKYDYSKTKYISVNVKIKIICKEHGEFLQFPSTHINRSRKSSGCPKCGLDKRGWGIHNFLNACGKNNGTLYVLRCYDESEEFYKIGITSRDIKKRFMSKKSMPYNYEVILEHEDKPNKVWKLEKNLHREFNSYKYIPQILFGGIDECFNSSIPVNELITIMQS